MKPQLLPPIKYPVKRGATVVFVSALMSLQAFAKPQTGAEYFREHPVENYTFQLNEKLSYEHDLGFSGEYYQAWIESKPANLKAKDLFLSHMKENKKIQRDDLVALVSFGLGWESNEKAFSEKTAVWVTNFNREIRATGLHTIVLQRPAMGLVRDNVTIIKPQIRQVLAAGKNVILSGLCKGVLEMLMAWTEVETEAANEAGGRPQSWGHVVGVLNMSGMNSGVYFADFLNENFVGQLLSPLIPYLPSAAENKAEYPRALSSLTTAWSKVYRSEYFPRLPKDIPYLNVVGILGGDGRLKKDRQAMNDFIELNQNLDILHAANDGFLEYPGTELPAKIFPRAATLAFEGSHMLTDGRAYQYEMENESVRINAYTSMYETLLDLISQN